MKDECFKLLHEKHVLLIIDSMEDMIRTDIEQVRSLLNELFEMPKLRILCLSREPFFYGTNNINGVAYLLG